MAFIDWNEKLNTGIKKFDEEHKKLIGMVNELHTGMAQGKGKEVLHKVLSDLVSYTKSHFASEESMMTSYNYMGLLKHKMEHDRLTKQAGELLAKSQAGESVMSIQVMNFLKDWLEKHILQTDKQYGPFLNAKGVA